MWLQLREKSLLAGGTEKMLVTHADGGKAGCLKMETGKRVQDNVLENQKGLWFD